MCARKHVEKISSGPSAHDYGHQGFKKFNFYHFGHVSTILEGFHTELERKNKTKELHMTLEDMTKKLFYEKLGILTFFGQILAIFKGFGHFGDFPY